MSKTIDEGAQMAISETAHRHRLAYDHDLPVSLTVAGLIALAVALHAVAPFNHDEAWFLQGAERLLDGGHIGTDIIDNNPPPVWWLSMVPVWLARQIGAPIEIAATVFTALLAALSLAAVDRLIESDGALALARRTLLPIAAILMLFIPGYDFGQREQWAALLTLPYVVARSRRADGATLSIVAGVAIGCVACLGFCLKAYLLLVPIALEIWLLARTRRLLLWFCPETIALGVTGLTFAALTVVYTPSYFGREVPTALLGYWTLTSTLPQVVRTAVMLLAPTAALAFLGYSTRAPGERLPTLAQALAVAGAASLVAALVQMTPWPYHFLPSVVFFDLSAAILLVTGTPRRGARGIRFGALAILIAIGLSNSAADLVRGFEGGGTASRVERLTAVFRAFAGANRTVFGLITSPRDVFPAILASDTKWAAPFCCNYLLAASVRAGEAPAGKRQAIRAAANREVATALAAARAKAPGVIVIDAGDHRLGFGDRKFDYLQWLDAHTNFDDILRHYREVDPIGPFRLFVRR
jgi:hypothetical protein